MLFTIKLVYLTHLWYVWPAGNIILFIDEVHSLAEFGAIGGGSKGSGLNFANLLKPSLGRGKLQVSSLIYFIELEREIQYA